MNDFHNKTQRTDELIGKNKRKQDCFSPERHKRASRRSDSALEIGGFERVSTVRYWSALQKIERELL